MANGTETLTVRDNIILYGSERGLELSQSIRGIPVANGGVSFGYNALTKRVSSVTAHFVPDRGLPRTPKLSAKRAEQVVSEIGEKLGAANVKVREPTYLSYYAECCRPRPAQLVWAISVWFAGEHEMFYVDAITGVVAERVQMSLY